MDIKEELHLLALRMDDAFDGRVEAAKNLHSFFTNNPGFIYSKGLSKADFMMKHDENDERFQKAEKYIEEIENLCHKVYEATDLHNSLAVRFHSLFDKLEKEEN